MNLYPWQEAIINHKGNIAIRGGRQTGKSVAVAQRIIKLAENYPGSRTLIIAASERQENYIIEKVKELLGEKYKFRSRALKTYLPLKNGSDILKYPVGKAGIYVEGLSSVDFLIADEAIHIGQQVWDSVLPMLSEPKKRGLGWVTILSNTRGEPKGYFWECFQNPGFLKIHVSAEDCPHISQEFLEEEKKRLSKIDYLRIYGGEFIESTFRYFGTELINHSMNFKFWHKKDIDKEAKYFLGIDPARFGRDEAAFVIVEWFNNKLKAVYYEELEKSSIIELVRYSQKLDNDFHFMRFYYDDGGLGQGFDDMMIEKFRNRARGLNNASKSEEGKRILKEDLYSNLVRLMEESKLSLLIDDKMRRSLESINFEQEENKIKISGSYSHLVEALIRAAWCVKEKNLKPIMLRF